MERDDMSRPWVPPGQLSGRDIDELFNDLIPDRGKWLRRVGSLEEQVTGLRLAVGRLEITRQPPQGPKIELVCGWCGMPGVRLYRSYGRSYRAKDNSRAGRVDEDEGSFAVPSIHAEDGSPWGFGDSAVPRKTPLRRSWPCRNILV